MTGVRTWKAKKTLPQSQWQRGLLAIAAAALLTLPAGAALADWKQYFPGSFTGADGHQHTATCSGFPGTDPTFSFWAKRGVSTKLVVFFEGGGTCYDSFTCAFPFSP